MGETQDRIIRACDSCYKRKIKCDSSKPQCNWCRHHDIPCTFTRVRGRRKKRVTERHGQLDERLARIEKILLQHPTPADSGSSTPNYLPPKDSALAKSSGGSKRDVTGDVRPSMPNLCQVRFAGHSLGTINSYSGIPVFSPRGQQWLQSRTGEIITSEKLCALGLPWLNSDQASREYIDLSSCSFGSANQHMIDLPDRETVEDCAKAYHSSGMSLVFPLIEPTLFEETMQLAYSSPPTPYFPYVQSARACIHSFLAFASRANVQSSALGRIDVGECVLAAHRLIPHIVEGPPNLDGLRAIIMLYMYKTLSGDFKTVDILLSFASRLLFTLGGHIWPPSELTGDRTPGTPAHTPTPSITQCHLRRLFWICYISDKELSVRTGRPPSINDFECDLDPAVGDLEQISTGSVSCVGSSDPCFLSAIRLSVIKSRTYTLLYSAPALRKSDTELLQIIRELDDDLEKWRVSLLPEYRPMAAFSQESATFTHNELRAVILRLGYHHCMAIIHQASSRCRAWKENTSGELEGVSSSLELAVEASRSSLLHLHQARRALVQQCFWFVIFFPISALLTIFCNILQNPLHPHCTKDLELLQDAPVIVREALSDQKHIHDINHIKSIEELMTLMGKLAKAAIDKANRESCDRSDSIRLFSE